MKKLGLPQEYTKKTRLDTRQRWMSWSAWPYCSRLKILDYRQIAQIQSTYVIGFADWILADGRFITHICAGFDPDWAFVWCGSKLAKYSCAVEQGRLIPGKAFCARVGG